MEANVRITNGVEVRYVTPYVAQQSAILKRFGFYIDEVPKEPNTVFLPNQTSETTIALDREQIIAGLKEAGIKYHSATGTEKLAQLLKEGTNGN